MTKICVLAGNLHEAQTWASGQNLDDDSWFYPKSISDLRFKTNFYVLVVGSAGQNIPAYLFERLYSLAMTQGRIGRL